MSPAHPTSTKVKPSLEDKAVTRFHLVWQERKLMKEELDAIAAIVDPVEDLLITPLHVGRLDDHEARAEFYLPAPVARGLVEVDNLPVQ